MDLLPFVSISVAALQLSALFLLLIHLHQVWLVSSAVGRASFYRGQVKQVLRVCGRCSFPVTLSVCVCLYPSISVCVSNPYVVCNPPYLRVSVDSSLSVRVFNPCVSLCPSLSVSVTPVCVCAEEAIIAKSNIVLDVKPWDDETDMAKLEECVRSVHADGLLWGACEYPPYPPSNLHLARSKLTGCSGGLVSTPYQG